MHEPSLLAHVVLGYSAIVDRQHAVVATQLTVFPEGPAAPLDGAGLLELLAAPWPERAAPARRGVPLKAGAMALLVNAAGEGVLRALLAAPPLPGVALEVPAFMAADASVAPLLTAFASAGGLLALRGSPREPLPPEVAACFSLRVEEPGIAVSPGLPVLRSGVHAMGELDAAMAGGAVAAIGWPFGDAPRAHAAKARVAPELQVIMELIHRVEREESIDRLEAVLKNDPTLAFRLLRYLNSPGFGLAVEISSFRHALMMLGYQRLKRWLALLLASAGKSAGLKPVMHAAVRRGMFMEELVKSGGDAELRGEIFICGVFSLLDRLLDQPFAELLNSVPVPPRVQQALLADEGPFVPYLQLVQAIEQESAIDIREAAGRLMIMPAEVNRALLAALAAAAQLE